MPQKVGMPLTVGLKDSCGNEFLHLLFALGVSIHVSVQGFCGCPG